ncbi:BON domain-containing protein [Chitinimonas sp. PSY-7]|uniref:BON domain-containing protein n=1 Tax=Chitinimonas sp. PSY-7 TaxID=3459088 RepID=UPI00403FE671
MLKRVSTLVLALLAASQLSACFPLLVAGVGTGVAVTQDRRASAVVWSDQKVEQAIGKEIADRFGNHTHVNVTSYNKGVLLSGEVPDEATKATIEKVARDTSDVRQVYNELAIMLPSSISARASDTALTTRVKTRMVEANKFSPLHVKVVSERKQVFLMGLLTRKEAQDAAQIASQTQGAEKVVTLFEHLD